MVMHCDDIQRMRFAIPEKAGGRPPVGAKAPKKKRARKLELSDGKGNGEAAASAFTIEVRFLGGLSQSQQDVFQLASERWSEVIVGDLPAVRLPNGEVVDDVVIEAQGARIDDAGGILGQAGPRFLRPAEWGFLPATGFMQFDTADLARMEANGSLVSVIIHEMGHVLGMGTLWDTLGLMVGCSTANPIFLGENAIREFDGLRGTNDSKPVPVANTGGPGTRCGHWRETVFGHELMTGFLDLGFNPLSRMTIGALEDMGYEVNYGAADSYELPSTLDLAMMGIFGDRHNQTCSACGLRDRRAEPVVLPDDSIVEDAAARR